MRPPRQKPRDRSWPAIQNRAGRPQDLDAAFLRVRIIQAVLLRYPTPDRTQVGQNSGGFAVRERLLFFPAVEGFPLPLADLELFAEGHAGWRMAMPRSFSALSGTGAGASHIRSVARAVLGNGITSRMEVSPARIMTRRSRPSAMPPCGGAPYSSASSSQPKRRRPSSSLNPSAANTLDCTSR